MCRVVWLLGGVLGGVVWFLGGVVGGVVWLLGGVVWFLGWVVWLFGGVVSTGSAVFLTDQTDSELDGCWLQEHSVETHLQNVSW